MHPGSNDGNVIMSIGAPLWPRAERLIAMKFGTDTHSTQRTNPTIFGEPVIFPLVPSWGWHLWCCVKFLLDRLPWILSHSNLCSTQDEYLIIFHLAASSGQNTFQTNSTAINFSCTGTGVCVECLFASARGGLWSIKASWYNVLEIPDTYLKVRERGDVISFRYEDKSAHFL